MNCNGVHLYYSLSVSRQLQTSLPSAFLFKLSWIKGQRNSNLYVLSRCLKSVLWLTCMHRTSEGLGVSGMELLLLEGSQGLFSLKRFHLFKIIISGEEVANNAALKGHKEIHGKGSALIALVHNFGYILHLLDRFK